MTFRVTVGIRFHDISRIELLSRCLLSVSGQTGVETDVCIAVQGLEYDELNTVTEIAGKYLRISEGGTLKVINIPNPNKRDLRSRLLNYIIDYHYCLPGSQFLIFIDYDDIWFSHALSTLVSSLISGSFALSYGDVHAADLAWTNGSFVVRDIRDVFGISGKSKADLRTGNFLPLHSYMFHTKNLAKDMLRYDESLARLEDYDVLLRVASSCPVNSSERCKLIGLYNFYTDYREEIIGSQVNTMHSPFAHSSDRSLNGCDLERDSLRYILECNCGLEWKTFVGELT